MKKIYPKSYACALYDLTLDKRGAALETVIKNFVALLARDRKLKQASIIIEEFIHYGKAQEGIIEIEIGSARELTAAAINQVKKSFGDKVEVESRINEALLGGAVVKTKDKILDGSLKTQLNRLKLTMQG